MWSATWKLVYIDMPFYALISLHIRSRQNTPLPKMKTSTTWVAWQWPFLFATLTLILFLIIFLMAATWKCCIMNTNFVSISSIKSSIHFVTPHRSQLAYEGGDIRLLGMEPKQTREYDRPDIPNRLRQKRNWERLAEGIMQNSVKIYFSLCLK